MGEATNVAYSASQGILDKLKAVKFTRWEVEVERVTVVKL